MNFKHRKGAILIITLWILAILTILSVGIAGRMGLELKLAGYYRDNMKALYLAKAAIERVIVEKEEDAKKEEKGEIPKADTLNETWANNPALFNKKNPFVEDIQTVNSYYSVEYTYRENKESEGVKLYGMADEASRININQIVTGTAEEQERKMRQLTDLLTVVCGLDEGQAEADVKALFDWIDADTTVRGSPAITEDDEYYKDIGGSYCKNQPLDSLEELLLVKGFDPAVLYGDKQKGKQGLVDYITIYTDDGKVNVNTAPKEILMALGFTGAQAADIINYRDGGEEVGKSENQPILSVDQLAEIIKLKQEEMSAFNDIKPYLVFRSTTFRVNAYAKVNNVQKRINCVVKLEPDKLYTVKYWNEE